MDYDRKAKKKKVLLMGKSGSGKTSMRSIIFSNYVAKDARRLGATIDVEHSHVKFLGNLTLNLWDCGGQDAFMENYLASQRDHVFSNVGVLIYVFDIESREFDRDMVTYSAVVRALRENSPSAAVFCLIHKMDLVQAEYRQKLFDERTNLVKERSEGFKITSFATSIWDQTLYKAWASIIYTLIPNLHVLEGYLRELAAAVEAEEIILFERTTFLVVTSVTSEIGALNPAHDRFERLSTIIKTFKQSLSRHTGLPRSSPQFAEFQVKTSRFNFFIARLTSNTYVLVVTPPGEAAFNTARINVLTARNDFANLDITGEVYPRGTGPAGAPHPASDEAAAAVAAARAAEDEDEHGSPS
ncbi:small monomeric GTPase [Xylona heveae TC161]|uniref:GTP-binding protein n=1 Tax=Xylona heveae (strain CBS 132557 / TC161) TaxID=1328760 RepID=A0A165JW60_XYLHT|nr:small monomeric GTPase [Xylona heveae TC161]KZF26697.1 small monomeric GTPase [Xylona heveae TC161]